MVLRKLPPKKMISRKISQKKGLLAPLYRRHFMPGKILPPMTLLISLEYIIFLKKQKKNPSPSRPLASFLTSVHSHRTDNPYFHSTFVSI